MHIIEMRTTWFVIKKIPDFSDYGNQAQFMKRICFSLQAKNHTFIFLSKRVMIIVNYVYVAFASMKIIANNYYVSKYEIVSVSKALGRMVHFSNKN